MGCLFAIFAGAFPRIAVLFMWLARPEWFLAAFGGSWIWPLLGVLILPFTTLMWVVLWNPATGISGFDWFWLLLAVVLDLGGAGGSAYANKERYPGYSTA